MVPSKSAGRRSGVNWMRANCACSVPAMAFTERLGEAGHAFQQDVSLAEEAEDQPVHQRLLADDHLAYLRSESRNPR